MKLLLAALAAMLNQPALATADEATAVAALQGWRPPKVAVPDALVAALGLTSGADEAAALSAIGALKSPSTATVALVAELQRQVAALTAVQQGDRVQRAVEDAIGAGRLAPALREQYLELGKKDFAMLAAILDAAPVIPGLAGQSAAAKAAADAGPVTALSAEQRLIAEQLGITTEAYLKTLQPVA